MKESASVPEKRANKTVGALKEDSATKKRRTAAKASASKKDNPTVKKRDLEGVSSVAPKTEKTEARQTTKKNVKKSSEIGRAHV